MAVSSRDFYEVLGVDRRATEDELRSAYRKLVKRWHPDRHQGGDKAQADAKIKEINEAYEVLSDPDKRAKYDRFGPLFSQMGGPGGGPRPGATGPFAGGADPFAGARGGFGAGATSEGGGSFGTILEDLFEELFKKDGGGRPSGARSRAPSAPLVEAEIELSLEDADKGGRKRLSVSRPTACVVCSGERLVRGQLCASCGGLGYSAREKQLEVNFPAGVREGTKLKVGDLSLLVHLKPHPVFTLDGDNLALDLPVTPHEGALGSDVEVPTLDGMVRLAIPGGTSSGKTLRLRGKGLKRRDGTRGDLYAKVMIAVPSTISDEERRLYKDLANSSSANPREALYRRVREGSTGG